MIILVVYYMYVYNPESVLKRMNKLRINSEITRKNQYQNEIFKFISQSVQMKLVKYVIIFFTIIRLLYLVTNRA